MSAFATRNAWTRIPFANVVTNVSDRVDDPSKAGVDRYVGLEHIDPGSMTITRWGTPDQVEAQKLRFLPGDVIFGRRRAYQKKVARADFEGICSAHALVLRAKPGIMDPDFLPIFLSSDAFLDRAVEISVGSLSPTVNWSTLAQEEFDLPPIDEQRRIADLLWAAESHRTATAAQTLALNLTAEIFSGDAVNSDGEGYGWCRLDELATIVSGVTLGPSRTGLEKNMPYLRVANVHRGRLDLTEIKTVGVSALEAGAKTLQPDDILVVEGHASVSEIGRAALWTTAAPMTFQNHLFRVRATKAAIGAYLELVLNSPAGRSYIRSVAKSTSGLNTINSTVLKATPIPAAPRSAQLAVVGRYRAIREAVGCSARQASEAERLSATIREIVLGGST